MGSRGKDLKKLESALFSAWKEDQPFEFGSGWHEGVMGDIRSRTASLGCGALSGGYVSMVLRFSAIAAAVTILFVIYAFNSDITPFRDLAMMFFDDPAGFIIAPPAV